MPLDAGGPWGNLPPHQLLPQVQAEVGGGPWVTRVPAWLWGLGKAHRLQAGCPVCTLGLPWGGLGGLKGPSCALTPPPAPQVVRAGQHV